MIKKFYIDDAQLIKKFGSWIRVLNAFYDFISHKRSTKDIEKAFPSFEVAWKAFVAENKRREI